MAEKWVNLKDKVVIVTGGSQGIGEQMVDNLKNNEAKVIVADVTANEKLLKADNVTFVNCDVSNQKDVESMVQEVKSKFGKIDALINNAGVSRPRMLVDHYKQEKQYELDEKDFDFMVRINQKGVFLCSQAISREMIKQEYGVIINMSSEAGLQGSMGQSAYAGTKAAVHAFTLSWAKELGKFNIRVVGVAPGINERTPMNNDETFKALAYTRGMDSSNISTDYEKTIPLGRPGKLDEIADLISFLVSDHSSYITGTTINITGGKSKG